jgi:hypothetical protein
MLFDHLAKPAKSQPHIIPLRCAVFGATRVGEVRIYPRAAGYLDHKRMDPRAHLRFIAGGLCTKTGQSAYRLSAHIPAVRESRLLEHPPGLPPPESLPADKNALT